jgi:plasmid stabilization system protein ParE
MSEFRLSRQADADFNEIADYLGRRDLAACVSVLESLVETMEFLGDFPGAGELRSDVRPNLRVFPGRGSARNFYYQTSSGIEVSTIIHGARDWEGMFASRER